MPSPDDERFQFLSEEVLRLRQRQIELEARIQQLEARNGAAPVTPPRPAVPQPAPPPMPPPIPAYTAPPPRSPMPPPIPSEPPRQQPVLETQLGLNWVNRIAVVTLMLGAAFLFKYGVDNDWIGPGARVTLGVAAALASLFIGDRLWHKGQRVFAQGLTGLGLGLLYLSFWASASFYELLSHPTAFVLMVFTTALAGYLAVRYNSQAIAILQLVGGYLTPVALSTGEDHPWILFGYLFLLNASAIFLARGRRWLIIGPLALAATILYYTGWAEEYFSPQNRPVATVFALLFYGQFAISESALLWTVVQLLAPIALAAIWDRQARFLPYEAALAAAGLAVAEIRRWRAAPSWTLLSFWLPFLVWSSSSSPEGLRIWTFGWLSVTFVLCFLWVPWWTLWRTRPARIGDLLLSVGNAAAYFAASYWLLNPIAPQYMGLLAVSIGGLHLALAKALWKPEGTSERESLPGLMMAGISLTFITIAVPIQFTGFRITMAWAMEGAGLAWLASRFRNNYFLGASAFVLAMTLARLATFDATMYSSVDPYTILVNTRFLTFAVVTASLWLTARFCHTGFPDLAAVAAASYVTGHLALLSALAIELSAWVDRAFTVDDARSVFTVSLSLLMAAYAVILVIAGVTTRTIVNRVMGLALIGLVVLKLYLLDVWQLGRFFRITAFLSLGALLLAVSYLYSRFRPSIERLWKAGATGPPPLH